MVMKNFKETYANKSTAISKLIFLESRFLYAVFNKYLKKTNKNKKKKKKKYKNKKFLKVSYCVTDQRKPKLYPIGCFQNSILNGIWLTKKNIKIMFSYYTHPNYIFYYIPSISFCKQWNSSSILLAGLFIICFSSRAWFHSWTIQSCDFLHVNEYFPWTLLLW